MADKKKDDKIIVKLQIEAGKATPAPPVGPALRINWNKYSAIYTSF